MFTWIIFLSCTNDYGEKDPKTRVNKRERDGDRGAILHLIKYIDVPYKSGLILKSAILSEKRGVCCYFAAFFFLFLYKIVFLYELLIRITFFFFLSHSCASFIFFSLTYFFFFALLCVMRSMQCWDKKNILLNKNIFSLNNFRARWSSTTINITMCCEKNKKREMMRSMENWVCIKRNFRLWRWWWWCTLMLFLFSFSIMLF